ncbi:ABC transporter permease [Streptomyces tardus]|nr:ABC transporter permease [Streptomyces tardus]
MTTTTSTTALPLDEDRLPCADRSPVDRVRLGLSDTLVLIGRSMRHLTRNGEQLVVAMVLPLVQLLVFRYLFGGAIDTGSTEYASYVIAGLVVVSVCFNASSTAVSMANDLQEGIVERFRSMPTLEIAVLTGHVVASVARNFLSITIIMAAGAAVGFRPQAGPGQWLGALALLLLFVTAVSWLAVIFALVTGTPEGASGLGLIIVFVPYLSSGFVPAETMPSALRGIAEHQPFSPLIDAVRGLLLDMPIGDSAWLATAWWTGALVLLVPLAAALFRRRRLTV